MGLKGVGGGIMFCGNYNNEIMFRWSGFYSFNLMNRDVGLRCE